MKLLTEKKRQKIHLKSQQLLENGQNIKSNKDKCGKVERKYQSFAININKH